MKSLSDYTTALRETATNLNLHGESVEMLVQMLANALYISEVEHIAYSQEASLERASLENSKIQHCVDQMYSVYRGANPRVIMNFKATKLFQFNPHDEIIKSNNFKVYYLGYYDSSTGELIYSSSQVYPDSTATIVGLLASDIYTSEWTISDNLYYKDHTESDLSGDLYMTDTTNEVTVDVTRQFYEHLRKNNFFDLTLPGYGCRIYYPETYRGQSRENLVNTSLSLSIYKYFSLSDAVESELKSLKLTGAVLQSFDDEVLSNLNAKEDYSGLIYINETSRDGIETIHYKANKSRFSGSYLATNSDLSYLLQEYYPSKIRTSGVTSRFIAPESSTIETLNDSYSRSLSDIGVLVSYEKLKSKLSGWTKKDLGYLPGGTLKLSYKSTEGSDIKPESIVYYNLVCSASIIPATVSDTGTTIDIDSLDVKVLKTQDGATELLTDSDSISKEGLIIRYKYTTTEIGTLNHTTIIPIPEIDASKNSTVDLEITLYKGEEIVDSEIIPVIFSSDTKNYYALNLGDDLVHIQTDSSGNFTTYTTNAVFYHSGEKITDSSCTYSVIPGSSASLTIDSNSGKISITGMDKDKTSAKVLVSAEYNGMVFTRILEIKKYTPKKTDTSIKLSVVNENFKPILTLEATSEEQYTTLEVPENTQKTLVLMTDQGKIEVNSEFDYSYTVLNNIVEESEKLIPELKLYYIPYASSNLLSETEKTKFITTNKSYYISQKIEIVEGKEYIAKFNVNLELYSNSISEDAVLEILEKYAYKFNQDLGNGNNHTSLYDEIKSLITKLSEVKYVTSMNVVYTDLDGKEIAYEELKDDLDISYFDVECNVLSIVSTNN